MTSEAYARHLPGPGPFLTVPNLATVVRTVAATVLATVALLVDDRVPWLIAGYLTYWLGDSLDGLLARVLDQETRAGAVFDICSDRLNTALLAAGLILHDPSLAPAVIAFLVNFLVIDQVLSLSFLCWPLVSPNHFARIDHRVWLWNWSHPAKALNNIGIVLAVLLGNLPIALAVVALQVAVKVASGVRVAHLLGARVPAA